MPAFRLRNRVEIQRQMTARVVTRSRLTKLRDNSVIAHFIAAAATEDERIYLQLAKQRAMFSIDDATGSDLDERATEIQPAVTKRVKQIYATTTVIYSRQNNIGSLAIPVGSLVAAADSKGKILFRTTAAGLIADGQTTSASIPVVAAVAGTRANVAADEINQVVTAFVGQTGMRVTNPSAVTNGLDRESDDRFRQRLKDYVRSLPRAVVTAVEGAARRVRLANGQAVLFAHLYEPVVPNGRVYLYIDDGTGTVEAFDDSYVGGTAQEDVILLSATGGETLFQASQWPIRDDIALVVRVNDVPIVRDVDWAVDTSRGVFELLPGGAFPTGLAAGDKFAINYRFFTGLLRETQRVVSGDPQDRLTYPGFRAAGIAVLVLAAQAIFQTLECHLVTLPDFDFETVAKEVKAKLQASINSLDVGDDVIVAELIKVAKQVRGVFNFKILELSGAAAADQVIAAHQVARIQTADIRIN